MVASADDIAGELLAAQAGTRLIAPFSSRDIRFGISAAYDVAKRILDRRIARGERAVGRKIGFTNRNIWPQYKVDRPIWAHVYDSTVQHAIGGRAELSLAQLVAPRIEPEIMFGLSAAPAPGMSDEELLECIAWMAHGYELVHCHFPDWKFTVADAIADFSFHGALVVGTRVPVAGGKKLAGKLAGFSIALSKNGEVQERGAGANVLGSPLRALAHLIDVLAAQTQFAPLAAGEIVTTGTLTSALPVRAGETWSTTVQGIALPGLTIAFR